MAPTMRSTTAGSAPIQAEAESELRIWNQRGAPGINETGLILACCAAGAAKAIEPPFWIFVPPGAELFNAGWSDIRFLTSISAIIAVVFLLAGGLLGDIYGRRRLLLLGLLATIVANTSLLFSPSVGFHIFWRAVAIVAGAFVMPLALAPLYVFFRGAQQARAFAWYIVVTTVAMLLASRQGRVFVTAFDWHIAYLVPAVIGIIALGLVWKYLPEQRVQGTNHIHAVGHSGWALIVLALVFGVLEATVAQGWLTIILAGTFVVFLIGVIIMFCWNVKAADTIVGMTSIRTRDVTVLIITGVVIQIVLMGVYYPTWDFYQIVQGRGGWGTLLAIVPLGIGMLVATVMVVKLLHARAIGQSIALGLLVAAGAVTVLAINPLSMPYVIQALALFVLGMTILATKTVWTNGFFQTLMGEYVGLNAAMHGATLQIGSAIGAVLSTQMLIRFGWSDLNDRLIAQLLSPEQVATLLRQLVLIILHRIPLEVDLMSAILLQGYRAAFATGYTLTMLVLAGIALLTALVIAVGVQRSLRFRKGGVAASAMLD